MRRDLIVSKGKCPLDVLAEQGEKIRNTWIFLSGRVTSKLENSEGVTKCSFNGGRLLVWEATEEHPEDMVVYHEFEKTGWFILTNICSSDIAFSDISGVKAPKEFIFVQMEGE